MPETIDWCYHSNRYNDAVYSIRVARFVAEQRDNNGQPLIGGEPSAGGTFGRPPTGFRARYLKVQNVITGKERRVTVFSEDAPLWKLTSTTIQLGERDGTVGVYVAKSVYSRVDEKATQNVFSMAGWTSVGWRYTTDQGHTYIRRVASYLVEQKDENGVPLLGGQMLNGVAGFPVGLKPRTVDVHCADSGKTRPLIVFSTDSPLWTGAAKTIQLRDQKAGLLTYSVLRKRNESWSGRNPQPRKSVPQPLPDAGDGFDSRIEADFAEVWQRTTKIHLTPQYRILGYRIDFAHLPTKTAIELDGYYYHSDPERFQKDRQRDRELMQAGWSVIRFAGNEVLGSVQRCVEESVRLIQMRSVKPPSEEPDR